MQITFDDATSSDVGIVLFFIALLALLLRALVPLALRLAKKADAWRAKRRRNRAYRPRKYADP